MKQLLACVLLAFSCIPTVFAQTASSIRGRVLDDSTGTPIAGASVQVRGTNSGTTTGSDGSFTLSPAGTGAVDLVFSFAGYAAQTLRVNRGDQNLTVRLGRTYNPLDDIVVVGYTTQRRRDLTASVSSVNSRQLRDIPINSAAHALAGRLAGVQITGTEGSPGAEVLIRVRGGGSITQDNAPLYIIDGVQVENGLSAISPQDIETVDVLKDASATAIYGARGANGVVIITTKSGRNARTTLSYNGFVGINKLANKLAVLNPYEFVRYQYERSRGNATDSASFAQQYGTTWDTLNVYKNIPFVDWQEQMFGRTAFMQTHNVSLNGGNASTQFNLSLTSNTEEGIMRGSAFDRKLATFKFDHNASSRLKVGFNTRYNYTVVKGAGTSSTGSSATNRLRHSVKYRPFLIPGQDIDEYDPDYALQTNTASLSLVNPILLNEAEYRRNQTSVLNLSAYADLRLARFLTFRSTVGIDITHSQQRAFDDTITGNSRLNGSSQPMASIANNRRTTLNNSNVLTYSNANGTGAFSRKNDLTVLVGHEIFQSRITGENALARLFPIGIEAEKALRNMNLGTAYLDPSRPPSYENENRLVSFFGRLNYSYDRKYLFSLTMRADGSSKFAEGNKWGYFPSGSVAWRLSNEPFMEFLKPAVNDLKLRLSYGQAGNNRIQDFLYLTQFSASTQYWLNDQMVTGFNPASLSNPNLVWEKTISRNIGLDLSFFNSRLQVTADFYRNTTRDLLVAVPVPTSSGYTKQIQNVGSTENKGVEIQVNAIAVQKKDFTWNANFNISYNKNKVTSLGTYQTFYLENSGWGLSNSPADYIVRVGDPVGSIYGLVTDGFYRIEDFDYNSTTRTYTLKPHVASNSAITSVAPQPGLLKFRDLNGDTLINDKDKTVIGVAQPKFFGGLNQQFTYRNFDMSIFINYQIGGEVYNANRLEFTNGYVANSNMLAETAGRWTRINSQGQVVTDPKELEALNANATMWTPSTSSTSFAVHSWAVEDASFLRINNITLGYTLPDRLMKRLKMQRLRFYITGNNLKVFTGYSGYDPEVSTRRSNPVTPGVDYSAYPRSRSYIFGVNLTL